MQLVSILFLQDASLCGKRSSRRILRRNQLSMDIATLVVVGLVIITALAFDFTNGFHDTANAMATSIATGAL